jgi:hypothetical protein
MIIRRDGSIRSANLPAKDLLKANLVEIDHNIYRCLITKRYFTDDKKNATFQNKQVTYDAVILGGPKEGQTITNIKLAAHLGGQYNYHERILRPAQDPITGRGAVPLAEQKGDIIYVAFVGKTSNPVIIGLGTHPLDLDTTGATKDDGMRYVEEYNGIFRSINKDGEFEFIRKGGVYNEDKQYFVPADRSEEEQNGSETPEKFQARLKFSDGLMLWEDPVNSSLFDKLNKKHTLIIGKDLDANGAEQGPPAVSQVIDGVAESITITTKSGLVIAIDGQNDKVEITTKGGSLLKVDGTSGEIQLKDNDGAALKLSGGMVGLGSASAELLDLFDQTLDAIIALTVGTGVGPSSPPINSAQFSSIKSLLGQIKGSI